MDLLFSLDKIYSDKIFAFEKPFEFRNKIGKNFKNNQKIYIYETSKHHGCKKIVGECIIDNIMILNHDYKIGCYPFLKYYCKYILKDNNLANIISSIYDIKINNYYPDILIDYIYLPEQLKYIKDTGKLPHEDLTLSEKIDIAIVNPKISKYEYKQKNNANKLVNDCDQWLKTMGYYNNYNESSFNYAILLKNIKKYENPKELNEFQYQNGKTILRPPQSWCYVLN